MTKPAPDSIIHGYSVFFDEKSAATGESGYETLLQDVFFADRPAAELTNGICLFIAFDTFHIGLDSASNPAGNFW